MTLPSVGTFLFLAAGEENVGEDGRWALPHPLRFRAFAALLPSTTTGLFSGPKATPASGLAGAGPPSLPHAPWEFPMEVRQCLELVLDLAARLGRKVQVVDVNRPDEQVELAREWFAKDNLYPILVASNGARLEGLGEFTPGKVKAFLRRG